MFHWKLFIAIIILIVILFINKRESFDDISKNILIDKSLTNFNGKTLIETENDNLLKSTLGYLDNLHKSFQQYPASIQTIEQKTITETQKLDQYATETLQYEQAVDALSDISLNIGQCIQKYYTNGSGTPQANPTDFKMFESSKYGITISELIAILNRLRQSFARTMNAINIHNYNIEKAYSNKNIVNMRSDWFNSITLLDNVYAKDRISRYKMNDTYVSLPDLNFYVHESCTNSIRQYDCEQRCNYVGHFRCWVRNYKYDDVCWPVGGCTNATIYYHIWGGNLNKVVVLGDSIKTFYENNKYFLYEQNDNKYAGMKNYTSNSNLINNNNVTNFISYLENFINLSNWSNSSNTVDGNGECGKNTPLNTQADITMSNYNTVSYYNTIRMSRKVFEDMILKYRTMIFTDSISLNLNPPETTYTEWLNNYSKNTVGNWNNLYTYV
jgi:hypothetical protein